MAPFLDTHDEVLTLTDEVLIYTPGPRTRRIQSWSLDRTCDPKTLETTTSITVIATHPDTDQWNVIIHFEVEGGVMRMRRLTLAPSEAGDDRAEITAAIRRGIRTQEVVEQVHWLLKGLGAQIATARSVMAEYRTVPRPGRRGRDDRYYAEVARQYVRHLDKRAPQQALARQLRVEPTQARDLVYAARQRGLLTGGGRGRSGGELTQKARRLLDGPR